MLHPQAEAALALWSQDPPVTSLDVDGVAAVRRDALVEAAAEPREDVAWVEDVDADGVPCRLYLPLAEPVGSATGCLLYAHGGGFVFGDVDTHDAQARRLANRTGRAVLSVDYRRPPEHPFPAAVEDLDAALGWLLVSAPGLGLDLADVAVCGDSAGGNLAVVAALRNPAAFTAAVLVYPFLDPRRAGASYAEENAGLSGAESAWYWQQYAGTDDNPDDNPDDPDLAPLLSERLGTLPRTLVVAAEHDVLLDEDRLLAERIAAAGGEVTCTTYAGMVHGFWRHPALFDDAERCLAEIAAFLHPR